MSLTSGMFELASGVCVGQGFTENGLLAAAPFAEPLIVNGAHRSYSLPAVALEGRDFKPAVYFTEGVVREIDLFPCDSPIKGWDDWSEEAMLGDKKRNDEWLRRTAGTSNDWRIRRTCWSIRFLPSSERPVVYTASWGTIGSYYDPKGGFSLIVVRFNA